MTCKMEISDVLKSMNIGVESTFIPFSQSRSKGEKYHNLNWTIAVTINGNAILYTNYSAGQAHCPAYKWKGDGIDKHNAIISECETGFTHGNSWGVNSPYPMRKHPIKPNVTDVIYSILMSSNALDCSGFEDWCDDYGYESDSIKAKAIYNQCVGIGLQFRNALSRGQLEELQEAFQDY